MRLRSSLDSILIGDKPIARGPDGRGRLPLDREAWHCAQHLAVYDVRPKAECPAAARANRWRTTLAVGGGRRPELTADGGRGVLREEPAPRELTHQPVLRTLRATRSGWLRSRPSQSARAQGPAAQRPCVYRPFCDVARSNQSGAPSAEPLRERRQQLRPGTPTSPPSGTATTRNASGLGLERDRPRRAEAGRVGRAGRQQPR